MKTVSITLLLACSTWARADNYCDSPEWSITHNMNHAEILKIAKTRSKIVDVECSIAEQIIAIQSEEVGIQRYPGRLLIADERDQSFIATRRTGPYTIFTYRYNPNQWLQFAMKDLSWKEGEALQAGPYKIIAVKEFTNGAGYQVKLLVAENFQFYGK
ncbi:hypothetical protein, partial [Pseudoduganella sp. LjRoot289]|uniref:hypothetical protein n=1 Tax=Pseudoduganella sp. LjRoot289 TaxID=3342314 RepID=UPI003F4F75D3